jgi:hypothetical protein
MSFANSLLCHVNSDSFLHVRSVYIIGIFELRESPGKARVLTRLIKNGDTDVADKPMGKETVGGTRQAANAG